MIENLTLLIGKAIDASRRAYAPYSKYRVGALLVSDEDVLFTGCNVENAAFPATICAERTALVKAVSEGVHDFKLLVVATADGGTPCGMCRQMLSEFSPQMRVICVRFNGEVTHDSTLSALLPGAFTADSLPESDE